MNTQRIASVARQAVSVLVSVYGVLSASVGALHLPAGVSAVLVAAGPVVLAIEHFVADPSTGAGVALVDAAASDPDTAKVEAIVRAELGRLASSLASAPAALTAETAAK